MNPNQFLGGDSSAIQAAMSARGVTGGQGQLNQVSPSSPSYQPTLTPPVSGQPNMMPKGGMQGKPPTSEAELIERAFSDRLKAISKSEQVQNSLQTMPVM